MFAYFLSGGHGQSAADDARLKPILCGGPYACSSINGGALIHEPGASRVLESYGPAQDLGDCLSFLPPLNPCTIYDFARTDCHGGVQVRLVSGVVVSVPVALVQHRQMKLGGARPEIGAPVTEYGKIATALCDRADVNKGLQLDDADLGRLLVLALAQHYRVTAHLLDHLGVLSVDDVDPMLGAIWTGDPKAMAPASAEETK